MAKAKTSKRARTQPVADNDTGGSIDWKTWGLRGLGAVAVIAVIAFFLGTETGEPVDVPEGTQTFGSLDRTHTDGAIAYDLEPPPGGEHNPTWLNCGVYDSPVPTEQAVHTLEHGAIWLTYQPDADQADIDELRSHATSTRNSKMLMSPYPGQPASVIATTWGAQLRLDSADDPRLGQFIDAFRRGDHAPEPGAGC